ncbi:hypothetical protein [Streptosporangium sp. NPDC003464]
MFGGYYCDTIGIQALDAQERINQLANAMARLIAKHDWTARDGPHDLHLVSWQESSARYDQDPDTFGRRPRVGAHRAATTIVKLLRAARI